MDEEKNGDLDEIMDVASLAAYLGLQHTVYRALARREIPHLRIGGNIRVSKKIVDEILRGGPLPR